jgi:phage N-6-adenine-methyltransferase
VSEVRRNSNGDTLGPRVYNGESYDDLQLAPKLNTAVMFSKASDEWRTPVETFNALNAEFGFDLDAAATADNSWVDGDYFGPDHFYVNQRDALAIDDWTIYGSTIWLNPPYSRCREFIAKAAQEARRGATVVCLVPSRTDTRWWHGDVWDAERNQPRPGVEVRFIKGRLKFGNSENSAPFPSVVVVFRPPAEGTRETVRKAIRE